MAKTRLKLTDHIIDGFLRDYKGDSTRIDSLRLWLWQQYNAYLEQTDKGNVLVFHDPDLAAWFMLKYV